MLPMFMNSAARMNSGTDEDDVVGVHPVEQLLRDRSHVKPGQQKIKDRARDHRMADRQSEKRESGDRDERKRERACEIHTPELALVGSNSVRGYATHGLPREPDVSNDGCDDEHDVDRKQQVEPDLQIGCALHLHEGDVVDHRGERHEVENDKRRSGDNAHDPAWPGRPRRHR